MSWTTIAIIAIAAVVAMFVLYLLFAVFALGWFSRRMRKMDEDFERHRNDRKGPRI